MHVFWLQRLREGEDDIGGLFCLFPLSSQSMGMQNIYTLPVGREEVYMWSFLACFFYWNSYMENLEIPRYVVQFINAFSHLSIHKLHQKAKELEFLNSQK